MTTQDIREFLDWLLPRKKNSKSIKADSKLADNEIIALCDYVSNFADQKEKFDWRNELKYVAKIALKYQSKSTINVNNAAGSIPKTPNAMPFLICQVLFCTAVYCNLYEVDEKPLASQTDILRELKNQGLSLSHNFFTRLGVSDYLNTIKYKQPNMLFNYPGQKHNELGVALKYLVYQAGKYNTFIDIFGGSCAASVAFPRRNNSVYVYNDLDKDLCNLIDVIAGDDYGTLIKYMNCLQKDLGNHRYEWNPFDFDFQVEAQKYYESRRGKDTDKELRIISDLNAEVLDETDTDYIIGFMSRLYEKVSKNEAYLNFKKDIFGEWIVTENPYPLIMSYFKNYSKILNFIEDNFLYLDSDNIIYNVEGNYERLGLFEHRARANQLRFYEWYAICCNVLNNKEAYKVDKAFLAVATIFINRFLTNGSVDISSILRLYKDSYELLDDKNKESNEWLNFLNTNFPYIITKLHTQLKKNNKTLTKRKSDDQRSLTTRTVIENMNCFDLIDKYKTTINSSYKSRNLFYSDSPYIATKQYKAGDFKQEHMQKLIDQLAHLEDKFIFSCRACINKESKKVTNEVRNLNREIKRAIFDNFAKSFKTEKLYVLTISKGKNFWQLVKQNGVAEIMITNYAIYSFKDSQYKEIVYKAYKYDDFIIELMKNINI